MRKVAAILLLPIFLSVHIQVYAWWGFAGSRGSSVDNYDTYSQSYRNEVSQRLAQRTSWITNAFKAVANTVSNVWSGVTKAISNIGNLFYNTYNFTKSIINISLDRKYPRWN